MCDIDTYPEEFTGATDEVALVPVAPADFFSTPTTPVATRDREVKYKSSGKGAKKNPRDDG